MSISNSAMDLHQIEQRRSGWSAVLSSPFLWAPALTVAIYAVVPYFPFQRQLLVRYLCSHPLEYATMALFVLGMTILTQKWFRLVSERKAIRQATNDIVNSYAATGNSLEERTSYLGKKTEFLQDRYAESQVCSRLTAALSYISLQKSSKGLQDHLRYLAEFGAERLHNSHSLVRTIVWAVPILGFLGTVMGITMAIANVTPEQLDSSMGEVTGGLAIAFDTTALALSLSLVLVFFSDFVRRQESNVLSQVEQIGIEHLGRLFPETDHGSQTGLLATEQKAAELLMQQTEELMQQHAQLWQQSTDSLRSRWQETLADQQQLLATSLASGMTKSLDEHEAQLQAVRSEFVELLRSAAEEFQAHLQHATKSIQDQTFEMKQQTELLSQLAGDNQLLAQIQQNLNGNLEAVRATETFEQTMQTLNAAVHLLSARTTSGKAA